MSCNRELRPVLLLPKAFILTRDNNSGPNAPDLNHYRRQACNEKETPESDSRRLAPADSISSDVKPRLRRLREEQNNGQDLDPSGTRCRRGARLPRRCACPP